MIEYSEDEPSRPMMDCEDEARHQAYLARERKKVDKRTGAKVVDLFEALKRSLEPNLIRDWRVCHGYYMDRDAYRGPSTFLAGLNYARIHRKPYSLDAGGHGTGVYDMATMDEDGDQQTEDEQEFFDACAKIGFKFKWRKSFDHSKNWKTVEQWDAINRARNDADERGGR